MEIAFSQADSARVNRYFRIVDEQSANTDFVDRYRAIAAVVWGDSDSLAQNLAILTQRWAPGLLNAVSASYRGGPHTPDDLVALIDSTRTTMGATDDNRISAAQVAFTVFLSLGQRENARRLAREEYEVNPVLGSGFLAGLSTAGWLPREEGDSVIAMIGRSAPFVVPYLRAIRGSRTGNAAEVNQAIRDFRSDSIDAPPMLRRAMDAFDGVADILAGDTTGGVAKIRSAFGEAGVAMVSSEMFTPVRFHLATALTARPETRREGISMLRSQFTDGFITDYGFLPFALLYLGEALEVEGDLNSAALAYSRLIDLWTNADQDLQPQVEEVRERLARLSGER